jgi:ribosomal protein L37AE/L43A
MNPWICPKCNRVYAPFIWECKKCNDNLSEKQIIPKNKYDDIVENYNRWKRVRFNGDQP